MKKLAMLCLGAAALFVVFAGTGDFALTAKGKDGADAAPAKNLRKSLAANPDCLVDDWKPWSKGTVKEEYSASLRATRGSVSMTKHWSPDGNWLPTGGFMAKGQTPSEAAFFTPIEIKDKSWLLVRVELDSNTSIAAYSRNERDVAEVTRSVISVGQVGERLFERMTRHTSKKLRELLDRGQLRAYTKDQEQSLDFLIKDAYCVYESAAWTENGWTRVDRAYGHPIAARHQWLKNRRHKKLETGFYAGIYSTHASAMVLVEVTAVDRRAPKTTRDIQLIDSSFGWWNESED